MGLETPPIIVAQPLRESSVRFTRMASSRTDHGFLPTPVDDAFLVTLELQPLPEVNVWLTGRHHLKRNQSAGDFTLVNLNVETVVEMNMPFDSVEMYFSRSTLNEVAREEGMEEVGTLHRDFLSSTDDTVVRNLAYALMPTFAHPEQANKLFLDHVAMAVLAHMLRAYSGHAPRHPHVRGGLTPLQVKRAQEMICAQLSGELSLEALARACGLSRSHFSRAFKATVGMPPHRWLMERRIKRAMDMLSTTNLSLAEISDLCGFSDQSHFSRAFLTATGMAPSAWRRIRRS
jgi:AraC-like DNA-binding protein